jgi:hypothetical protein
MVQRGNWAALNSRVEEATVWYGPRTSGRNVGFSLPSTLGNRPAKADACRRLLG